jgi:hypothetical protein
LERPAHRLNLQPAEEAAEMQGLQQQQQSPDNTVTSSCLSHLFYLFIFSFFLCSGDTDSLFVCLFLAKTIVLVFAKFYFTQFFTQIFGLIAIS